MLAASLASVAMDGDRTVTAKYNEERPTASEKSILDVALSRKALLASAEVLRAHKDDVHTKVLALFLQRVEAQTAAKNSRQQKTPARRGASMNALESHSNGGASAGGGSGSKNSKPECCIQ